MMQQLSLFQSEEPESPPTLQQQQSPLPGEEAQRADQWGETPEQAKTYLLKWAEKNGYPDLVIPLPQNHRGFKTALFPAGKEYWLHSCEHVYDPNWLIIAARIASKQERN